MYFKEIDFKCILFKLCFKNIIMKNSIFFIGRMILNILENYSFVIVLFDVWVFIWYDLKIIIKEVLFVVWDLLVLIRIMYMVELNIFLYWEIFIYSVYYKNYIYFKKNMILKF